jgi:hypothetical protein
MKLEIKFMIRIGLFLLLLFSSSILKAQSVMKTMLRLPDTGETTGYTITFGEDADFDINTPYFIVNGDGTATDTITGLMWEISDGGEMTYANSHLYCDTLSLGGFTDWRLPSAHESFSILNLQFANPALDPNVFVNTAAEYWWTADRQVNDSTKIWVTNSGGGIGNHRMSETISAGGTKRFHVRAVRDVNTPVSLPDHFTDNFDGTITDNLTNLIWEKIPLNDTLTWEQALVYADSLNLAGQSDWRLPNIKELQSINDESLIDPSFNTAYFNVGGQKKYWSSTTLPNQITKAWYLDTQFGITTYDFKTNKHYLICVRGSSGIITAVQSIHSNTTLNVVAHNPIGDKIILNNEFKETIVELFDAFGRLKYKGTDIENFDVSRLPAGVYFLKVIGSKVPGIQVLKIN